MATVVTVVHKEITNVEELNQTGDWNVAKYEFLPVARVTIEEDVNLTETAILEYAYQQTQNITANGWAVDSNAESLMGSKVRSSMMGDQLVIGNSHYEVAMFGFKEV